MVLALIPLIQYGISFKSRAYENLSKVYHTIKLTLEFNVKTLILITCNY
jgi:hypothetical protein